MNAFNGFLATVVSLSSIAAGGLILLIVTETVSPQIVPGVVFRQQLAGMVEHTGALLWRDVGIAVGLIIVGLFVLLLEFRSLTRTATPGMILVRSEPEGVVRMSLDSIAELAKRTGLANRDVNSIRCYVRTRPGGLSIRCVVGLRMGADVPAVSAEVQQNIREAIERLTSLTVSDVPVRARYQGDRDQTLRVR